MNKGNDDRNIIRNGRGEMGIFCYKLSVFKCNSIVLFESELRLLKKYILNYRETTKIF